MYQAGLVLEGGGMKGAYTAGVLDFFLEKEMEFSSVYGVSAGAVHMCSYLSKQKGRSIRISTKYGADPRYCSIASLLLTGDLFNVKTCYDTVPNKWEPFDHKTYESYHSDSTDTDTEGYGSSENLFCLTRSSECAAFGNHLRYCNRDSCRRNREKN